MVVWLRRSAIAFLGVAGILVLAIVLYLVFADLGAYKARLEAYVTRQIGRPFAIDGPFQVRVLPAVELLAERVRVGNAAWGSSPQMLEVGRLRMRVGLGSLISGPVEIRSLELTDVTATLEKKTDGTGNWEFGSTGSAAKGAASPVVIRDATLRGLRVTYRETGQPERAMRIERLTLAPAAQGRTALSASGKIEEHVAVKVEGTLQTLALPGADLRIELAVPSLASLRPGLPAIPASLAATYSEGANAIELKDIKGRFGEIDISGQASVARGGKRRVELDLATPRLDFTPFLAGERKHAPERKSKRYVFDETPLPLDKFNGIDLRLHLAAGEIRLRSASLRDFDGTLTAEDGRLVFAGLAKGGVDGTLDVSVALAPASDGRADFSLKLAAHDLRAGFEAGSTVAPGEVPPTSVEASLKASGASARQMAAGASGRIVVTQKPGEIETGVVDLLGGDALAELAGKLNPFAAKDAFSVLDCTVIRSDIVDGEATIKPFLFQTRKVAVVADGRIDLRTEALALGFSTRPREGVGISAGMFTNPFVGLGGTLASPSVNVGAKAAVSGAVAVATGGMSVLAQGLLDRLRGTQDQCPSALTEAAAGR